ncbi:MAG: TIM barrel protein, partial [Armatimonadetes bacterium]|nr:TIM barrel protein [Armatimonadota bacterium]
YICHSAGVAAAPGLPVEVKKEGLDRLARVMDTVAGEAADVPVYVAADVHYHGIAESVADCEYLIARLECPNAGPLLNIGHLTTCRQPGWELAQRYPERIRIVGWKDHVLGQPDMPVYSVELGTGDAPLGQYVAVLRPQQVERRHVIAFEHVPTAERKAALARSLRYMEQLWQGEPAQ